MYDLSKIALGTVQFGLEYGISNQSGKPDSNEISDILDFSLKAGISTLDTASAYGDSEQILGEYGVKGFDVITKFLPIDQDSGLEKSFEQSLLNLQTESVYGYLAHRADAIDKTTWHSLQKIKEQGKVKKIGFSIQTVEEFERVTKKGFMPDLIQVPFNLFDQRFKKICIELKSKGVEIHTRSTFLQGLFFVKSNHLSSHFKDVQNLISKLQEQYQDTLAQNLLRYALQQDFIDKVIIGIQSKTQLSQNIIDLEGVSILKEVDQKISDNILNPALWPRT
jgi:aryl-alcohol dehydrogenase-like predicted oxidoreductase